MKGFPNVTVIPDCPEKFTRWQIPCLCSLTRQDESGEEQRRRKCRVARNIKKKKKKLSSIGVGCTRNKKPEIVILFLIQALCLWSQTFGPHCVSIQFHFFPSLFKSTTDAETISLYSNHIKWIKGL